MTAPARGGYRSRDLLIVAAFTVLLLAPSLGKAYTIDEPYFLLAARHILRDPLHPGAALINWYGEPVALWRNHPYPPLLQYILAAGIKATGGAEWPMRLLMFPFDLGAAAALYLLAARFLARPLLPTLIALACPAYAINMQLLMAEKWVGALGFLGLYALVRGVEDDRPRLLAAFAALAGVAMLVKYSALFLLPAAAFYLAAKRVPRARLFSCLALAAAPAAAYVLYQWLSGQMTPWGFVFGGARPPSCGWVNRLRAMAACVGGCGAAVWFWPVLALRRDRSLAAPAAAGAVLAGCLFVPALDWESVRGVDRWTGLAFSSAACLAMACWFRSVRKRMPGWELWGPWALSVLGLQLALHRYVTARFMLFMIVPVILGMASALERTFEEAPLRRWHLATLAASLVLSLSLASVDAYYTRSQKVFAQAVREEYIDKGKTVWFSGHLGFQYYLERAGAKPLDRSRGGWDEARPGDLVVVPQANTTVLVPSSPRRSKKRYLTMIHPLPLRLIRGWDCQAGFYASIWGFLPYAFSTEPVEQFTVVELL
ncbi:MAG: glycosyltransferase family 39 protein [Elusimicrobia bacterium]|nr:glycosyltransferase family 39 protein [Elusimicrobiota bacterium]